MSDERDLLAIAVSRYADMCGPTLHPDCPFARDDGSTRRCDRECRKIVAGLVRPQAQRDGPEMPFDAQQALLLSRSINASPTTLWSATALLGALQDVAETRAVDAKGRTNLRRWIDGTSALASLEQLGLNTEKLFKFGVVPVLAESIDTSLMVAKFQMKDGRKIDGRLQDLVALRDRYTAASTATRKVDSLQPSPDFRNRVTRWLESADPETAIKWELPSELPEGRPAEEPPEAHEFRWLIDRLTKTYLHQWPLSSLHAEYRYTFEGWAPSLVPHAIIGERRISPDKLAREIAGRAVTRGGADPNAAFALVLRASEAIDDGNREIAAAIFETARSLSPSDPTLANNHGFCLLPDDPAKALEAFSTARRLGLEDVLLSANTALAHLWLGAPAAALAECNAARKRGVPSRHPAYIWSASVGRAMPQLIADGDAVDYLHEIATLAATQLELPNEIQVWGQQSEDS